MEQRSFNFSRKSLNTGLDLKREMALAIKASGLSRALVVDRMNQEIALAGLRTRGRDGLVTVDMLNKWLAPEDLSSLLPTKLMKIFGTVVGSARPAETQLPDGYRAFSPEEILIFEYGKEVLAQKKAQRRTRRLVERIEGLEL